MLTIPGRSGKASGSPEGPGEYEHEFYMTVSEVSSFLRELADAIDARGRIEVGRDDWSVGVDPREPLKMEIQYKTTPEKRELEVQVKLKENP